MIYLDNAATTFPKPISVTEAVAKCMKHWCANPGRAGHMSAMKSGESVYDARQKVAELIGAQPGEIIFTSNCTDALNMALHGTLKKGDHVVTTMMEHNSVLRPLNELKKHGVETTIVKCGADGYPMKGAIRAACRENTRMIVCTAASNVTGTIMPIEEIGSAAKEKGILFLVDGSQGAGVMDIDVKAAEIDMLAASGHKSLMGPQGTGFLYVKTGVSIRTTIQGGTGTESKNISQPQDRPEGFEAGTVNVPGITGLAEGIRFIKKIGIPAIRKYEEELISCLYEETLDMKKMIRFGPQRVEEKVGIFSFNLEGMDSERTAEILDKEYGIAVRAGFHCAPFAHRAIGTERSGCVRMSVGMFNTMEEMRETASALREIEEKYLLR